MYSQRFCAVDRLAGIECPACSAVHWRVPKILEEFVSGRAGSRLLSRVLRTRSQGERLRIAAWLLDESFHQLQKNAALSVKLAALAALLAQDTQGSEFQLAARIFLANSLRVSQSLRAADRIWKTIKIKTASLGTSSPVLALASYHEGLFWSDLRHFEAARRCLRDAVEGFEAGGHPEMAAFPGIGLSKIDFILGRPLAALRHLQGVARGSLVFEEPVFLLSYHHALTAYTAEAGHVRHAIYHFAAYEWMYAAVGQELMAVRGAWLKGRLAYLAGSPETAALAYRWVRDEMVRRDLPYDAALAGLDLALALARCGRHEEVMCLAEDMVPVFQAHGIEREARRALAQWVEAVRASRADAETVEAVIERLKQIARTPLDPHSL